MATPRTEPDGRIVKRDAQQSEQNTLRKLLQQPAMKSELARALPRHLDADRMARILFTSLTTTPNLDACDQASFMGCVLQASQLGLEVNTPLGHCYLIPRKDRDSNRYYCTMILGYQGMIELALRSGKVSSIKTIIVREGDLLEYEDGLKPILRFKQSGAADREVKQITHAIGIAYIKNGDPIFEVLSRAQIDARMGRSDSFKGGRNSPWKSDYEAMARKTAVRALFKWIPKSPEIAEADALEDNVERGERHVFNDQVRLALERQGLQAATIDTVADELPAATAQYDEETGEVMPAAGEVLPAAAAPAS